MGVWGPSVHYLDRLDELDAIFEDSEPDYENLAEEDE